MKELSRPLRVFLSHSSGDKVPVREIHRRLQSSGIDVWLDEEKLLPGQTWVSEIASAVRDSDVAIICLSKNAVSKEGYVQKEIKLALDVADEKPDGTVFLIPLRLEDCRVPDRLRQWQWVDLFGDVERAYRKLLEALRLRAKTLESIQLPTLELASRDLPRLNYFYYISRTKIEMLLPQLAVTPPLNSKEDLIRHTVELMQRLEERGLVKSLSASDSLESDKFYKAESIWHHGLFYFKGGIPSNWHGHRKIDQQDEPLITAVSYLVWTKRDDSLILLIGSPDNILGEKVAGDGIFIPGTGGSVDAVFRLVNSMRVDEPYFLATRQLGAPWERESNIPGIEVGTEPRYVTDRSMHLVPLPGDHRSEDSLATSLALFCLRYLGELPARRLSIVFKVFSTHSAAGESLFDDLEAFHLKCMDYDFIKNDPKRFAKEEQVWQKIRSEVDPFDLQKLDTVYIGSPLYTALL